MSRHLWRITAASENRWHHLDLPGCQQGRPQQGLRGDASRSQGDGAIYADNTDMIAASGHVIESTVSQVFVAS